MPLMTGVKREDANRLYDDCLKARDTATLRRLCKEDLFFLLTRACKRLDIDHDWLYDRCREVEADPDGRLDLWPREYYKSSIVTFGLTVQDILKDPDITVGIFSHTRPIAKAFMEQIKRELEGNRFLINLFPDVLWDNAAKEAPKWSLDGGIIVRRKSNPKEATVEAWGLVDGQPTSKHYALLMYDDVVTKESVTSPDMIKKVTDGWALSLNLGGDRRLDDGTIVPCKKRYVGTRYHQNDTYSVIMERKTAVPRVYYPTLGGKDDINVEGEAILKTREYLSGKRNDMGVYIYGCQMLNNPSADDAMGFDMDWLQYYDDTGRIGKANYYILVDPASEKKKTNDYTVMWVVGMGEDGNYYIVDGVRDRLNLTERTKWLFKLVRRWRPRAIGYERYGMQSDIEHIKYMQEQEGYRFGIIELGGAMAKNDRIRRLVPIFEQRRVWLPRKLLFKTYEGKIEDLIGALVKFEYESFPVSTHDDMLDCLSRILDGDLGGVFPKDEGAVGVAVNHDDYDPLDRKMVEPTKGGTVGVVSSWRGLLRR